MPNYSLFLLVSTMIAEEYPFSKAILGVPLKIIENVVVRLDLFLTSSFLEGPPDHDLTA